MKNYFDELGIFDNLSKKAMKEIEEQEMLFFKTFHERIQILNVRNKKNKFSTVKKKKKK